MRCGGAAPADGKASTQGSHGWHGTSMVAEMHRESPLQRTYVLSGGCAPCLHTPAGHSFENYPAPTYILMIVTNM